MESRQKIESQKPIWQDLIKIGKFGFSFEDNGSFRLRINQNFQSSLLTINEFFVIIDDRQVRFVKIEQLNLSGVYLTGRLTDTELVPELRRAHKAWLAIDGKSYDSLFSYGKEVIGLELIYNDQRIGIVTDVFDNGAQDVLVVTMDEDDKIIMIPDVDEYIMEKDISGNRVVARNIQELIEL